MEILDRLRAIEKPSQLNPEKFYALAITDGCQKELGRFMGKSHNGSAFQIMNNLVRQDTACKDIVVADRALAGAVFEIGEA